MQPRFEDIATTVPPEETGAIGNEESDPGTQELDLNNAADLDRFVESAEDVFADAVQFEELARNEQFSSLSIEDITGDEIYNILYEKLAELQQLVEVIRFEVVPSEDEVNDTQIDQLQGLYDDMILLRNHVRSTYTELSEEPEQFEVSEEAVEAVLATEVPLRSIEDEATEVEVHVVAPQEPVKTPEVVSEEVETDAAPVIEGEPSVETVAESEQSESVFAEKSESALEPTEAVSPQPIESTITQSEAKSEMQTNVVPFPSSKQRSFADAPAFKHVEMTIRGGDHEPQSIQFHVAKETEARIRKRQQREGRKLFSFMKRKSPENQKTEKIERPLFTPAVVTAQQKERNRSPLAAIERHDPINRSIPGLQPKIIGADVLYEKRSLSDEYLSDVRYQEYIRETYTSPAAFERLLDTFITQIEGNAVDRLEQWLEEERPSTFEYLADMTVAEVEGLADSPDVRQLLARENIKYETFLDWVDMIDEMKDLVQVGSDMTFAELFAKSMVESKMQYGPELQEVA
ncbi:MAG: hypothetical protein KC877_02695 [Candidatus Kaiserbacteria bacterium]|nr:hypothetical protein [Candidatus Kaiserbacteria bacterium]MCB9816137.1 hypothetical protein [Candidatus Nomurabacteria bacterium]